MSSSLYLGIMATSTKQDHSQTNNARWICKNAKVRWKCLSMYSHKSPYWKWTEETFWGLQSYALGTVYSHKMSSWLQFSAGLSVEKYIYTACISILCSIKLSGFLPLDMFQFKTYNYQHSWVSEKMCFVKCKSHNGLHKKMNTMSFLAHGLVSECSEESNVEASPDTVTVGCLTFFLWLCKTFGIEWPWQSPRPKFYPVDCCV